MLGSPVRVFIVDDSAQLTEMLGELIADPGNVEIVGTADTAATAINDISRLNPDVVIVDLQLRVGNGFDVLKAVRNLPGMQRAILVLFTNHLSRELQLHAKELGADFFMDKSREHAQLVALVQEQVRLRGK